MHDFLIAFATGTFALLGNIVANKMKESSEERQRSIEISRKNARKRIEELYKPLSKLIFPTPPYDDRSIDMKLARKIVDLVEENSLLASPSLENVTIGINMEFFHTSNDYLSDSLCANIRNIVDSEYSELKALIGYGPILKQNSFSSQITNLYRWIKHQYSAIKMKIRQWRSRRRAKKILRKDN